MEVRKITTVYFWTKALGFLNTKQSRPLTNDFIDVGVAGGGILQVILQIGFTSGLLVLAVSPHQRQSRKQETTSLLVKMVLSNLIIHSSVWKTRSREREWEISSFELRSEFGCGGSANQVYLISEFRMQRRQSSKIERQRERERNEQQCKINPCVC